MTQERWHGSTSGYSYHRCRCDACKAAHARIKGGQRDRRRAERVMVNGQPVHPRARHGTKAGYSNYACRCEACIEANRQSLIEWRRRSR